MAEQQPLRSRSLSELREMLKRQERLLGDCNFISRLPDKGKKISDFVEKLKIAILEQEELRRQNELLSVVRLEFQQKQAEVAGASSSHAEAKHTLAYEDSPFISTHSAPSLNWEPSKKQSIWAQKRTSPNDAKQAEQTAEDAAIPQGKENISEASIVGLPRNAHQTLQPSSPGQTDNPACATLVDALQRISIVGEDCKEKPGASQDVKLKDSPFQSLPNRMLKTPHYIEVLEQRAQNPVTKKSTFKTNLLSAKSSASSGGSSNTSSPGGASVSLSAGKRAQWPLDDIMAARLPPLHHLPAQLLSIEESVALQSQQKAAYEEMQAKLAAQKLATRLDSKMDSYEPKDEAAASYREVRDKEVYSSDED